MGAGIWGTRQERHQRARAELGLQGKELFTWGCKAERSPGTQVTGASV